MKRSQVKWKEGRREGREEGYLVYLSLLGEGGDQGVVRKDVGAHVGRPHFFENGHGLVSTA